MKLRTLFLAFLCTTLWINLSEVLRYFLLVRPVMRRELAMLPNVASMDLWIFSIWGVWDTILTVALMWTVWLCREQFGHHLKTALIAGTSMWMSFFLLFWLGMVNMNLSSLSLASIALPWAWLEMVMAGVITQWGFKRFA